MKLIKNIKEKVEKANKTIAIINGMKKTNEGKSTQQILEELKKVNLQLKKK